jgi:hypothetical protein
MAPTLGRVALRGAVLFRRPVATVRIPFPSSFREADLVPANLE